MPSSVMSTSAPRLLTRGMVSSRSRSAVNGAVSASTCSSSAAMVAPSWSMWVRMSRARVADRAEAGQNLWYACRHHAFGGSVQVLADPTGFPLWTSEMRPGSTHNLTAARELVLPALYPHAARGLPVLADKGYLGAGIGVHTPVRRPAGGAVLHTDTRTYNQMITDLRAPTETRAHPARPLAGTRPRHRLPATHRHHRRPRPHLNAARPLVRKPHYWEWLTARAFGRLPRRHRTRPRALLTPPNDPNFTTDNQRPRCLTASAFRLSVMSST